MEIYSQSSGLTSGIVSVKRQISGFAVNIDPPESGALRIALCYGYRNDGELE